MGGKNFNGEKKYEYRRVTPNTSTPYVVVFYASSPTQKIVGEAIVVEEVSGSVEEVISETVDQTPHDIEKLEEYFSGKDMAFALKLSNIQKYNPPKELDEKPPMNFKYIK